MSEIEWCDRSDWNPIRGCTRVSEGCRHCYAEQIAGRFSDEGAPFHGFATRAGREGRWTGKVELIEERLLLPLKWRKPAVVFVNSAFDPFHEALAAAAIDRVLAVMALAPQHQFIVLTKRAKRMRLYFSDPETPERVASAILDFAAAGVITGAAALAPLGNRTHERDSCFVPWPLKNVYLGVSAEDQPRADERIPDLLATPAAGRFVSAEPLLGPIDFRMVGRAGVEGEIPYVLTGLDSFFAESGRFLERTVSDDERGSCLNGVILGGESGPHARPMHPDWARSIRDQCAAAGVPFFFKQHGEWIGVPDLRRLPGGQGPGFGAFDHCRHDMDAECVRVGKARAGRLLDGREHNDLPWRRA